MRIVLMASGKFCEPTLRYLAESEHDVPLVLTQPARGSGRGRKTSRTPVAAVASELNLEVLEVENVNDDEVVDRVCGLEASLGLVIAFGQKLGPKILSATPGGCVNLHASLLPKYRGAAPINWAIAHGEEKTGCTVFRIDDRMDTGPILSSRWTYIKPEETAGELHDRLAAIGVDAVQDALNQYVDNPRPEGAKQDDALATPARKLKKSDGVVSFDREARAVANHICAMTPWPGATARFESDDGRWEAVQILRARVAESTDSPTGEPGTINALRHVGARDGFVELLEVKPSSSRVMSWQDYVNGRHVAAGDRFTLPTAE